jgi:hypothetical protein
MPTSVLDVQELGVPLNFEINQGAGALEIVGEKALGFSMDVGVDGLGRNSPHSFSCNAIASFANSSFLLGLTS